MTVFYPDISHYQSGLSLHGAPLVIAKATQGSSYTDPTYASFKAQAASLGIPFAGYHWMDTSDLQAQASHAHGVIGSVPAMWDCEAAGVTVPRIVELTAQYRALGGVVHLCYLPLWWWRDHMGSPDLRPLATAGLALVSSNYPSTGYSDSGPGWAAYGGVTPVAWQYTDAQPFNGQRVDFNAYKGDLAQLWALLTGSTITPSTSTGADMEQSDRLIRKTDFDGRVVGDTLADLQNLRQFLHSAPGAPGLVGAPPAGSVADLLARFLAAPPAGSAPTQDQVTAGLKAALADPAVLAVLAKAVNDDAAHRLAS